MTTRRSKRFAFAVALALFGLLALASWRGQESQAASFFVAGDEGQDAAAAAEPTMEQKYKNIQALKGLPASQMSPLMNYIAATLGMTCGDCHVRTADQWEFDKDDNNHKKIARRMITMTMEINKQNFNGRPQVSCMTCHQGHDRPVGTPSLPMPAPSHAAPPSGPMPQAADILAKYLQAIGGKDAVEKVQSRVIKGASVAANNQGYPLEIQFAAPDKYTLKVDLPQTPSTQKLNGAAGWLKNARDDRAMNPVDLARARSLAMSLDPAALTRDPNLKLAFGGFDKVGDRDAVALRAQLPDKRRLRLLFDKESGLLLRRIITTETVIGLDPEQTDYEDYRDVDGVKVPFTIRTSYLDRNYSSVRKFTEIKHNAKIDAAAFALPAAK